MKKIKLFTIIPIIPNEFDQKKLGVLGVIGIIEGFGLGSKKNFHEKTMIKKIREFDITPKTPIIAITPIIPIIPKYKIIINYYYYYYYFERNDEIFLNFGINLKIIKVKQKISSLYETPVTPEATKYTQGTKQISYNKIPVTPKILGALTTVKSNKHIIGTNTNINIKLNKEVN